MTDVPDLPPLTADDIWRPVGPDRDNMGDDTKMDAYETLNAAVDRIGEGRAAEDVANCILGEFDGADIDALAAETRTWGDGDDWDPRGTAAALVIALDRSDTTRQWISDTATFSFDYTIALRDDCLEAMRLLAHAVTFMGGFDDCELHAADADFAARLAEARVFLTRLGGKA